MNRKIWPWILLVVVSLIVLSVDLFSCASRYLYATTEWGLFLTCGMLYAATFRSERWRSLARYENRNSYWKHSWRSLMGIYVFVVCALFLYWLQIVVSEGFVFSQAWHRGLCFFYYLLITLVSATLIWGHMQWLNLRAMAISILIGVVTLTGYEAIALSWGHAWHYNGTIIAWAMGVPIENILFVYTFTPVSALICFSLFRRHNNDLVAFWKVLLSLTPPAMIVEIVAIYKLKLWITFPAYSLWPMGLTNIEEFVYYELFMAFSLLCYIYFERNLKEKSLADV